MTSPRLLLIIGAAFLLLLLGAGSGIWWYLFGPNEIDSADLVPANTFAFASIPDAATVVAGYQTSHLKTLVDSPNSQPLRDAIVNAVGQKNIDLLQTFLPNLSGQSFIAITHFDYDHPEQIGLIAAMKPKAGLGDFGSFLDKFKATWPNLIKQGKTGTDTVAGVDYDWIQGPGAPDKICVARIKGWIVVTWGEASLQDWILRFRKKPSTSSLAEDLNYRKALAAVGDAPMTLAYINYHCLVKVVQAQMAKINPAEGDYLAQKLDTLGAAALATRFESGEIVDRFTFLMPRPAQIDAGMAADPCPFETLKFTGPDTRFYWASSINWKQYYKRLKEAPESSPYEHATFTPVTKNLLSFLQNWVHGTTLDTQQNIFDALGSEVSLQVEWSQDATYPEVGLFVKLDKPDDFKPTVAAIVDSVRKAYATTAVVKEIDSNGQKFATLQMVQSSPISPTITEDGPYLGLFLTENQAVRSFQRDESIGLTHNKNFMRQVGDKRNGAQQVFFLDSPYMLNRAYGIALPYLSLAGMFNKDLAAMLKGRNLPDDLTWLAPIGTWSCIITPDEDGLQGYSVSGIGNQGIFLAGGLGGAAGVLQNMGLLPKPAPTPTSPQVSLAARQNAATNAAPLSKLPVVDGNVDVTAATDVPSSVIYITSEGKVYFDSTQIPVDQFGDFLKAKQAANPSLKLAVQVDRFASPDVLSRIMDAGASAGFGVLPYTYSAGTLTGPPPANSAPPVPNNVTNAASSSVLQNAPVTNPLVTPFSPYATTNSAPVTNSTSDATPPIPEPIRTQ